MKKEELMKLEGMTEDLAAKIVEMSADEMKGMIPKTRLDEVIAERDNAKKDHADVLKQLGALQKETGDVQSLKDKILVISGAGNFLFYHQTNVDLDFDGKAKELSMISGAPQLAEFIDLHTGTDPVNLPAEDEVVLSIGVCNNMGIGLGDTLTIRNADLQEMELTVSAFPGS